MARTFDNAHYHLEVLDDPCVVKLVRSAEPFHSVLEMVAVLDDIFHAVEDVDGASYGLFIDSRRVLNNDDPAFQEAFRVFRKRLDERFARVGVLLASDPGIKTLEDAGVSPNVRIFTEETPALAWAAEGLGN